MCLHFSAHNTEYTKFAKFTGLYFPHFTYFATSLRHFTEFRMLFSAVLMNIPNSNVCLNGGEDLLYKCNRLLEQLCHKSDNPIKLVTSCEQLVPNLLTISNKQCEDNLLRVC